MSTHDTDVHATCLGRFAAWLKDRTGLSASLGACPLRDIAGRPGWWSLWISLILCGAVIQAITGWCLWMYYSPGAQTAWESVYYVQYEVPGGWLLRGLHYWTAQTLVGLLLLYVTQMIVRGVYRAPREFVFWSGLLLAGLGLGLCLTGDLLSWDQNAFASTKTRVSFLNLLPAVGQPLFRLAAGGPEFGHLTLTRFFTLHVACFAGSFFLLVLAHMWLVRQAGGGWRAARDGGKVSEPGRVGPVARGAWWADPVVHSVAALGFLVVVLLLVFVNGPVTGREGDHPGDVFGKELGAPADRDPANAYAAARPEWTFRGLYGFSNAFPGELKVLAIFVFPTIFVLLVLLMPVIGYWRGGHLVNLAVFAVLLGGLAWFSYSSWAHDWDDPGYHAALAAGEKEALRVKELIRQSGGIPPTGALSLLRSDPVTQGPRLWKQQCAVCHAYTDPAGTVACCEVPTAPDLAGFGGRESIAGLLDPGKIKSPRYFGNTRFAAGMMVRYVESRFSKLAPEDRDAVIDALAAESQPVQPTADKKILAQIDKGRKLIADKEHCARCHHFHDAGQIGTAPELTAYASRQWLLGVLADPTHSSFYGPGNDRMPAYVPSPGEPNANRLQPEQIGLLADWLLIQRREFESPRSCCAGLAEVGGRGTGDGGRETDGGWQTPVLFVLGQWEARRSMSEQPPPAPRPPSPAPQALALYKQQHCAVCHAHTGTPRADIKPPQPCAPDLGGFAGREWLAGLFDPKQVAGPKYFGNSALRKSPMVDFVRNEVREMDAEAKKDLAKLLVALAAEAQRDARAAAPAAGTEAVKLTDDLGCTACHKFYDKGALGKGPELTGYGSREWLAEVIADPGHVRFYGKLNDGMPSYRMFPETPGRDLLDQHQIERLAEWLRGK